MGAIAALYEHRCILITTHRVEIAERGAVTLVRKARVRVLWSLDRIYGLGIHRSCKALSDQCAHRRAVRCASILNIKRAALLGLIPPPTQMVLGVVSTPLGCGTKHQSISRCAPTCAPDSYFPMRKTHIVSLRKHNACSTARDTSLYECCSDGNVNPASYRGRHAVGIRRLTVDCSTHAVFSRLCRHGREHQ